MEGEGGYDKYNLNASSCALTCPIQLHRTDKSSCGTLFRVHQGTDYTEDGQVFPWDLFQGAPGDRLHEDKRVFP